MKTTRSLLWLLLVAAVLLAGCADYGPLRELQALPEASLPTYPGATLLAESSEPARPGAEGMSHAVTRRWFGAEATRDEVITYYDGLLTTLGWSNAGVPKSAQWLRSPYRFTIQKNDDPRFTFSWLEQLEHE